MSDSTYITNAQSIKKFKYSIIGKTVVFISVISYSMYLVKIAVVAQVIDTNFPPQTLWENVYMYIFYWVATIILAMLLYLFYEKSMTDLRDR